MHPSVVRSWPHSELSKWSFQSCDLSLTTIWVMWYRSRGAIGSFNCILEILKVQIGLTKVPLQSAVTWLEQKMIMWLNNDVITLIGIFITRGAITCCENFPKFEIHAEIKTRISVELREFEKLKISPKNLFTPIWQLTRLGFRRALWLVDRTVQKWTVRNLKSSL